MNLIELADGSLLNPGAVARLTSGGPGKDYPAGWTFVELIGGGAFWVMGDATVLGRRVVQATSGAFIA